MSQSSPSIPCSRYVRPGAAVPAGAELLSIERGIGRWVAGRRRGCRWREGGVPRCSGMPTPAHVSSIPPVRVLSRNPFRLYPPLRDPRIRIYIARLSQTGP